MKSTGMNGRAARAIGAIVMVGWGLGATLGCQAPHVSAGDATEENSGKKNVKNRSKKSGVSPGADGVNLSGKDLSKAQAPDEAAIADLVSKDGGSLESGVVYMSLAHLAKSSQGTKDLDIYRFGVTKTLNSLSMKEAIKRPDALDEGETLYRVNLADFSLRPSDINAMNRVAGADKAVKKVGNSAVIQGDWFVFAATRPEVYDQIMGVPNFVGALENELKIKPSQAVYVNVETSEVTFAPRVLERIPIEIGGKPGGYYWRSYDFARTDVQRRGFQNPQALRQAGVIDLVAGEYFWSLPNGLQGYMLSGFATQHRIDAQPFVATDANRPQDGIRRCVGGAESCGYVINGESCMTCHANGVKLNKDIAGYVGTTEDEAMRLYGEDTKRFAQAISEMGFPDVHDEPINATLQRFKKENNVTDKRSGGSEVSPTRGTGVTNRLR